MKDFFLSSYYFWVTSRIILVVLGGISLISIATSGERLYDYEALVNFFFFIYLILLTVLFFTEVRRSPKNALLCYITGACSLVIGITLLYVVFAFNTKLTGLAVLMGLWIIFLGLFDLSRVSNAGKNDNEVEV